MPVRALLVIVASLTLSHPEIAAQGIEPVLVGLAGVARGAGLQAVVDT